MLMYAHVGIQANVPLQKFPVFQLNNAGSISVVFSAWYLFNPWAHRLYKNVSCQGIMTYIDLFTALTRQQYSTKAQLIVIFIDAFVRGYMFVLLHPKFGWPIRRVPRTHWQ